MLRMPNNLPHKSCHQTSAQNFNEKENKEAN